MGQKGSKDRLTKGDLEFLKSSTRYDEDTIKVKRNLILISMAHFLLKIIL
jgi:hypothetical protein